MTSKTCKNCRWKTKGAVNPQTLQSSFFCAANGPVFFASVHMVKNQMNQIVPQVINGQGYPEVTDISPGCKNHELESLEFPPLQIVS